MPRRLALLLLLAGLTALPAAAHAGAPAASSASTALLARLSEGGAVDLPPLDTSVPSPSEFLGYPLGTRFTHHQRILEYLRRLADASPRVTLWQYGETYEGRPLTLVAISSPENLARLDALRAEHLRLADPRRASDAELAKIEDEVPVVVWLAYGVHGNEPSSSEAAMAAAYTLAAAGGDWPQRLAGTLVLIDPLVNPDGRERYVSFYDQARGREPDPDPVAAEHREPWPGGRQNHYLVDLNRDWSWATQQETRARLTEYRRWEPQVYVDYHEMFSESSYFFPPAAEPVNPLLDRRTVAWLDVFGRANGAAFDRQGWPYYKAESFDLYYPGYGDSYPGFRGAVGMTYEVAGHGRAGLAIDRRDGTVLTLADRIARHLTTSLATVRTAAEHRHDLLATYAEARSDAAAKSGPAYLWSADAPEAGALAKLLTFQGIEVSQLSAEARLKVYGLAAGEEALEDRAFPVGTYVVDAGQPLGNLVRALLDRAPKMGQDFLERQRARLERNVGTEFYDITAWSLPLAFDVQEWVAPAPGHALEGRVEAAAPAAGGVAPDAAHGRVGFLVPPAGLAGFRFAGELERRGVAFRVALGGLDLDGTHYPSGTLFIPRVVNRAEASEPAAADSGKNALRAKLDRWAADAGVRVTPVDTSYTSGGISLGSDLMPSVGSPKIGLVSGDGVSPTSFGFLWHLLDQQVRLPYTRLDLGSLGSVDLGSFDVLILPDGWGYGRRLSGESGDALARWVRRGGVLIGVGGVQRWLEEKKLTAVRTWKPPEAKKGEAGKSGAAARSDEAALDERAIYTPGAILATRLTPDHPLAVGLPSAPPVLVVGSTVFEPTGDPQVDVLTAAPEAPVVTGMAWPEAEKRLAGSLLMSFERQGRGAVVLFAQEPDFRLFWRGTAPLLLNAALYGPSLTRGGGF